MVDPLTMEPGTPAWRLWCLRLALMYLMLALHSDKWRFIPEVSAYLDEREIETWQQMFDALSKTVEKGKTK
jgi:hypothetical protein